MKDLGFALLCLLLVAWIWPVETGKRAAELVNAYEMVRAAQSEQGGE